MNKDAKIYITNPSSFKGAAFVKALQEKGYSRIVGIEDHEPRLNNKESVESFFQKEKPDYVFVTAGKSAGIMGNIKHPAGLMIDNIITAFNVIQSAFQHGVKKLLYIASSCCYPKHCPQPMKEEYILSGPIEATNESYAIAKIAGIKLCQAYQKQYGVDFICAIPATCYGPGDDFSEDNSHVVGALIKKTYDAICDGKSHLEIWGTGNPKRDFIYIEDFADACVLIMQKYNNFSPINISTGTCITISDLAKKIQNTAGFKGDLVFNTQKPDGMPLKYLDTNKLTSLGWKHKWPFEEGLKKTWDWFEKKMKTELSKYK